jgi:ParB/RepB/Spo0J family partition protein
MTTTTRHALANQAPLRVARIPLHKIRVHPRNLRLDLGDLTDLAESLIHEGQHQPAQVHRRGEFFELLDGHRRYGASVIARRSTLDCLIVPVRSDAEAIQVMLATGVHARQLSPGERARGIEALLGEFGQSVTDVARQLGVTPATVRRWRAESDDPAPGPAPRRRAACRPRRAPTTVSRRRVHDLADAWATRTVGGLTAEEARRLLAELYELAGVPAPPIKAVDTDGGEPR